MRCQAYKASQYIIENQNAATTTSETQETRPLFQLALNRVNRCFPCPFGWIKAAQGGALEGLWACELINIYVFFHVLKFQKDWTSLSPLNLPLLCPVLDCR